MSHEKLILCLLVSRCYIRTNDYRSSELADGKVKRLERRQLNSIETREKTSKTFFFIFSRDPSLDYHFFGLKASVDGGCSMLTWFDSIRLVCVACGLRFKIRIATYSTQNILQLAGEQSLTSWSSVKSTGRLNYSNFHLRRDSHTLAQFFSPFHSNRPLKVFMRTRTRENGVETFFLSLQCSEQLNIDLSTLWRLWNGGKVGKYLSEQAKEKKVRIFRLCRFLASEHSPRNRKENEEDEKKKLFSMPKNSKFSFHFSFSALVSFQLTEFYCF